MIDLKPCPFCGGYAEITMYSYHEDTISMEAFRNQIYREILHIKIPNKITCTGCGMEISSPSLDIDVSELWNRREKE